MIKCNTGFSFQIIVHSQFLVGSVLLIFIVFCVVFSVSCAQLCLFIWFVNIGFPFRFCITICMIYIFLFDPI